MTTCKCGTRTDRDEVFSTFFGQPPATWLCDVCWQEDRLQARYTLLVAQLCYTTLVAQLYGRLAPCPPHDLSVAP